jgi:hypothetical protein
MLVRRHPGKQDSAHNSGAFFCPLDVSFPCVPTCGNVPLGMVERRRARERRTAERPAGRIAPQNAEKGIEMNGEWKLRRGDRARLIQLADVGCRGRATAGRPGVVDDQPSLMSWVRRRAAKGPLTCGLVLVGDAGREVPLMAGHLVPLLVPPLASVGIECCWPVGPVVGHRVARALATWPLPAPAVQSWAAWS